MTGSQEKKIHRRDAEHAELDECCASRVAR
jgi:hypothetical protein